MQLCHVKNCLLNQENMTSISWSHANLNPLLSFTPWSLNRQSTAYTHDLIMFSTKGFLGGTYWPRVSQVCPSWELPPPRPSRLIGLPPALGDPTPDWLFRIPFAGTACGSMTRNLRGGYLSLSLNSATTSGRV